jgi:hypothetical protein
MSDALPELPPRAGWVINLRGEDGWLVRAESKELEEGSDVFTPAQMRLAVLAERERCLRICESLVIPQDAALYRSGVESCAAAIRAGTTRPS